MPELTLPKRMQTIVDDASELITKTPDRLLKASRGALVMTREEAEHLIHRGHDLFEELVRRGEEVETKQTDRITGWLKQWQERGRKQVHMAEEQLEAQVQHVLRALHIPSADDVDMLNKQIDKIGKKLEAYLKSMEQAALPIPNYTELGAREVIAKLAELDEQGLLAVQKFEMAHDNRKSVLREIENRLQALQAA
ncbi:MAG: phasin family protein [Caldilineales bacterium]|nr:phasin family protein [Caldilineales bacterium]MDW8317520.1 phasin family protein [Anaerolineae bacterium]